MVIVRNMRIGRRLALTNLAAVLALVTAAAVGSFSITTLHRVAQRAVDYDVQVAQKAAQIKADVLQARRFEKDFFINIGDDEKTAAYKKKWDEHRANLGDIGRQILELDPPEQDRQIIADIDASFASYASGFEGILAMIRGKQIRTTQEANQELTKFKESAHKIEAASDELSKHAIERVNGIDDVIASGRDRAIAMLVSVALCGTAIAFFLGWWTARSITRPVTRAVEFAKTVATGDLTARMDSAEQDEIGDLLRALQAMNDNLLKIVERVREGAESVAGSSAQIASANSDLSSRTEQQASSLQQTAASMEQFTSTVAQSGSSAKLANQLVVSATEIAAKGGQIVEEVVQKMDGITSASERIAEIIGVVDGIAFQTNILALNAAVEAARAGEQGRGFAVVAAEVRTLAQRSAHAAREIREMISDSVQKVDAGSKLVHEAGTLMAGIVSQVKRVADLIGEVSSAVTEQSSGIGGINTAVAQMDNFTQQNAALVEESAAAATSLRDQARRLSDVVATFKVGITKPAAVAPGAPQAHKPTPPVSPAASGAARKSKAPTIAAAKSLVRTEPKLPATAGASDDWIEF